MKIVVCNNHLNSIGGSETFTYTVAKALKDLGHDVNYFCIKNGIVGKKLQEIGINFSNRGQFDLAICSHYTTVNYWKNKTKTIQICHGTVPDLEQPTPCDGHFSISEEVQNHLLKRKFSSQLIKNPIDITKYSYEPLPEKPKHILCLTQNIVAKNIVENACKVKGWHFRSRNKHDGREVRWDISNDFKWADVVVSLGRGAYEAMAAGKNVFVFDSRSYMGQLGDGMLNIDNLTHCLKTNCSGRAFRKSFTPKTFIDELEKNYDSNLGLYFYNFAKDNFNPQFIVEQLIK